MENGEREKKKGKKQWAREDFRAPRGIFSLFPTANHFGSEWIDSPSQRWSRLISSYFLFFLVLSIFWSVSVDDEKKIALTQSGTRGGGQRRTGLGEVVMSMTPGWNLVYKGNQTFHRGGRCFSKCRSSCRLLYKCAMDSYIHSPFSPGNWRFLGVISNVWVDSIYRRLLPIYLDPLRDIQQDRMGVLTHTLSLSLSDNHLLMDVDLCCLEVKLCSYDTESPNPPKHIGQPPAGLTRTRIEPRARSKESIRMMECFSVPVIQGFRGL